MASAFDFRQDEPARLVTRHEQEMEGWVREIPCEDQKEVKVVVVDVDVVGGGWWLLAILNKAFFRLLGLGGVIP